MLLRGSQLGEVQDRKTTNLHVTLPRHGAVTRELGEEEEVPSADVPVQDLLLTPPILGIPPVVPSDEKQSSKNHQNSDNDTTSNTDHGDKSLSDDGSSNPNDRNGDNSSSASSADSSSPSQSSDAEKAMAQQNDAGNSGSTSTSSDGESDDESNESSSKEQPVHPKGENHIIRPNERPNKIKSTNHDKSNNNSSKAEAEHSEVSDHSKSSNGDIHQQIEQPKTTPTSDQEEQDPDPAEPNVKEATPIPTPAPTALVIPKQPRNKNNNSFPAKPQQHHNIDNGPSRTSGEHKHRQPPDSVGTCTDSLASFRTCLYQGHPQELAITGAVIAFLLIVLRCCCCNRATRRRNKYEQRGQYRAVAARYTDDAFADDFSDDEGDFEDDYESWAVHSNGKRAIEMKNLGQRDNGLSLDEING